MKETFTKEQKEGIKKSLDLLRSITRYDLYWEQMDATKEGAYILYQEYYDALIKLLKE